MSYRIDETIKYSFIVPAFNVEKYIGACLDSVIKQKCSSYEVIVIDDGSTDNTGTIADEYSGRYSQIRVIHQENKGNGGAKNSGVGAALGKWLIFVDGDDMLADDFILETEAYVDKMAYDDVLICNFSYLFENGKIIDEINYDDVVKKCNLEKYKYVIMPAILCAKVFSNRFWKENRIYLPEGRYYEDIAVLFMWLTNAKRIWAVDKALYIYRQHGESTTKNMDNDKLVRIIDAIEDQYQYLITNKLYYKYKQRFEAYAIIHIITEFIPKMCEKTDGFMFADKCMDYVENRFPQYKKNPFIKEFSLRNKLFFRIATLRWWKMLNLIIQIKDKAKNLVLYFRLDGVYKAYKMWALGAKHK